MFKARLIILRYLKWEWLPTNDRKNYHDRLVDMIWVTVL